jgi:hypothetical protein
MMWLVSTARRRGHYFLRVPANEEVQGCATLAVACRFPQCQTFPKCTWLISFLFAQLIHKLKKEITSSTLESMKHELAMTEPDFFARFSLASSLMTSLQDVEGGVCLFCRVRSPKRASDRILGQ